MNKILFSCLCLFFSLHISVHADFNDITIKPILPKNQNEKVYNYFDLFINDEKKQTIYFELVNKTNKKQILSIFPGNALTSLDGEIFISSKEKSDVVFITDKEHIVSPLISVEKEIVLNAHEKKTIPVTLRFPEKKEGTYLGGVIFELPQTSSSPENKDKDASFKVDSKYAYSFAIQMNFNKKEKISTKNITFEKGKVIYRNGQYFLSNFARNNAAAISKIDSLSVDLVNPNDDGKKVSKKSYTVFKFAPMNQIEFLTPLTEDEAKKLNNQELLYSWRGKIGNEQINITEKTVENNELFGAPGKKNTVNEHILKPTHVPPPSFEEKEKSDKTIFYIIFGIFIFLFGIFLGRRKKQQD